MRDVDANPVDHHLTHMIQKLTSSRATGVLVVTSDDVKRRIAFVEGNIHSVWSSTEKEMLGSWLVERGKISDGQRALALLQQGPGEERRPLGEILAGRGLIDRTELEHELRELAFTIAERAASSMNARCEFHTDRAAEFTSAAPRLSTVQLLLASARAVADQKTIHQHMGSLDQAVWPARDLDSLLSDVALNPTEAFLLSRLRGVTSITALIRALSMPEEQALRTLFALTVAGILSLGTPAHPTPVSDEADGRALSRRTAVAVDEDALDETRREERQRIRDLADECPRMDHYRALGLLHDATHDQVVSAWNSMARRYSSDRLEEEHLRDLARELDVIVERAREAYEVLSNPKTRRRYDPILESVEKEQSGLLLRPSRGDTDPGARREIVEANFKRAGELVKEGEIYLAIQLLEQACALEPRPSELLNLARLLLRNPLWTNRALSHIRRATEIDPNLIEGWIELAEFWRRRNNPDMQRKSLEKALGVDPDHERAATMYRLLVGKRELDRYRRRLRIRHG